MWYRSLFLFNYNAKVFYMSPPGLGSRSCTEDRLIYTFLVMGLKDHVFALSDSHSHFSVSATTYRLGQCGPPTGPLAT